MDAEQEQRYIIDRVGEETDLEECSLCFAASCFACVSDHCTALKKLADSGCVFYKDAEEKKHLSDHGSTGSLRTSALSESLTNARIQQESRLRLRLSG